MFRTIGSSPSMFRGMGAPSRAQHYSRPQGMSQMLNSLAHDNDTLRLELEATKKQVLALQERMAQLQAELEEAQGQSQQVHKSEYEVEATLRHLEARHAKELARAKEKALEKGMTPALEVYDDLRRALESTSSEPHPIRDGVVNVHAKLEDALKQLQLVSMGHKGETFDPTRHEAIGLVETTNEALHNTVAETFETGFLHGETVTRAARVLVYQVKKDTAPKVEPKVKSEAVSADENGQKLQSAPPEDFELPTRSAQEVEVKVHSRPQQLEAPSVTPQRSRRYPIKIRID